MVLEVKVCNKVLMEANEQVMPKPAKAAKGKTTHKEVMKNAGIKAMEAKLMVTTTTFPKPKTDFRAAK